MSGNGHGPAPYRRGWRAPWRGQWGTFRDGHSRASHLFKKIEGELLVRFDVGEDRLARLLVRAAARQGALSEILAAEVLEGDGKARRAAQKRWTGVVEGFRRALALLEAGRAEPDIAAQLAATYREPPR